ncbi:MAG: hypothetical protein M3277_12525 [Actinomycetota bacterium]|nr:hypothetical protein [Actinomycetota bacterium]
MQATHTLLSGETVVLDAPYDVESGYATNFLTVAIGMQRFQELKSGALPFAEAVARQVVGVLVFDEEYEYKGGRLRMGSAVEVDPVSNNVQTRRSAVWEGTAFSLNTNIYEGHSADLVAILDEFEFHERENGLELEIKQPEVTRANRRLHSPRFVKEPNTLGLIAAMERTRNSEYRVPRWAGKSVRGGELYKTEPPGESVRFLLVGPSSITEIIPDPSAAPEAVAEDAANLVVQWNR